MLPLDEGQVVQYIEYLPAEMVPDIPLIKNSIVDVRCIDNYGRQFIVEMQMLWTDSFKSRVLFNASKAYVRQLDKGVEYKGLKPVYALSLINEVFDQESPFYYHHYRLVHTMDQNKTIDGLQLIFVEIPKFTPKNITDRKLFVLWMRYISEIQNGQEMIDEQLLKELQTVPEIAQALELTKESAYTKAELEAYDKYWDSIRTEKTLIADAEAKGEERGRQEGRFAEKVSVILNGLKKGLTISQLSQITELNEQEVINILNENGIM